MDTLYDLLGALPRDDAEGLRVAFRRAVKGAHPDLKPGDPNAALKFRQIVRANEILGDVEQRAAYDHLLEMARLEGEQAAKHAFADRVYKVASGVMALAMLSAAVVGSYALFLHLSASGAVASSVGGGVATREGASIAAVSVSEQAPAAAPEAPARTDPPAGANVPAATTKSDEVAAVPPAKLGPPLDITPREARPYWALGVAAYHNGDLNGAVTRFDQAIRLDPKFAPAYIDRGIVFYRLHKFDRALADIAHARRLERASHSVSVSASAKKPPQAAIDIAAKPAPAPQTAEADLSRQEGFPFISRP
jgi:tetratricopeptide (TPR) repeat protein